jgi:hypothetical protein
MGEERRDERSVFRQVEAILSCLNIDKDVYKSCEMVGQAQVLNGRIKPGVWSVLMCHNSHGRSCILFEILFTFQRLYTAEFKNMNDVIDFCISRVMAFNKVSYIFSNKFSINR